MGSWVAPALPPMEEAAGESAPPPQEPPQQLPQQLPAADAPSNVRLGFADGTEVALATEAPDAVALRAVADVLLAPRRR